MNSGKFDRWVEAYGRAWETKDPEASPTGARIS